MRVRSRGPLLLVALAVALPVTHAGQASAATGPRERAALLDLFTTDAALARARAQASDARLHLTRVQSDLRSVRARLGVARSNQRATQRALAQRLNEIYRARPLDTLGVLLAARTWSDINEGLDLLDRLSRSDSSLVRSARHWEVTLKGRSRTLHLAEGRAQEQQRAWAARVAELKLADNAQRSLIARLRRQKVKAVTALAAQAERAVTRAQTVVRPQPHGGGSDTAPAPALPAAPPRPSLAPGTTLSVSSTAYSLPGHTASGLPVGQGICATDPRVIPLGTRFEIPGYGPCVAADTGSAVIGATIDIWMADAPASAYGRQTITITFR